MAATVQGFGADPETLYFFEQDGPELLPYATLQTARRNGDAACRTVDAVYEWQGAPLAFLIDADSVDDAKLQQIRRLLAMRGDAPYLGVVAPGSLRVFRIALDGRLLRQARVDLPNGPVKGAAFSQLANLRPGQAIAQRKWISSVVLRLLTGSMKELRKLEISDEDAISLVGRALFTRFLADRDLLPEGMSGPSTSAHLFDTPRLAQATSDWLDATFNGDLLPLSKGTFDRLPPSGLRVLGHVLRRALDGGQLSLGWQEKWDNLDFAHIPVGVLSQAYELYMRDHARRKQRREGGYFTPRPIAELMVQASFRALQRQGNAKTAKILDPAAGAGMFLLTAFRELVAEHWRSDGSRPDTDTLRQILYEQLVGFDINEGALRFAALGLYLLSIELDPEPRPVDKLAFDDLRDTVLHRVTEPGEAKGKELGSLGPAVGAKHANRYDLVIGNPPWASSTKLPGWEHVREKVAHIAAQRGIDSPPRLPNEGLDLPFVWRAMEWAKPSGQIAFALHARLLFQQGDGMPDARQALFEALDVTSVINGAELRRTQVWPQISAPFCILFATNRTPGVEAGFRFVSPRLEGSLNGAGNMRIDAISAEVVASRQLCETPDTLKILFRGSKVDLGIVERIRAQGLPTLEEFWRERLCVRRGRMRGSGNGYQKLRATSRMQADGSRGDDASELQGLPEITPESFSGLYIDRQALSRFTLDRVHRKRSADIFSGPLLVIHESASARTGRVRVGVSDQNVVYSQSYHGYSTQRHANAGLLARYLGLVLGSRIIVWFALVTSGKFGVERDVVEKVTLDRIPILDFDTLNPSHHVEVATLTEGLTSGDVAWDDVDEWVADLYGLSERDLQTISDTLEFNLPFAANKRNAQAVPTDADKARFCRVLEEELAPWSKRFGSTLAVEQLPPMETSPWHAISVRAARRGPVPIPATTDWAGLISAADATAASEIILENDPNQLLVGRLAQRRYWSTTQARLLAQRIAWSHIGTLKGHDTA